MNRTLGPAPLVLISLLFSQGQAAGLQAPIKVVSYDISAELNPVSRTLTGKETLRFTNPSTEPIGELKFHLYWNAFRNNRSTFFRESGGLLRDTTADQEAGWGSIDITAFVFEGKDLLTAARFESPDDGNLEDRTVLSVPLPRSLAPRETIQLDISWKSKIPRLFARSGYVRDYFFIGQWFPKIGVYEPAGRRRRTSPGWNCHQYHANSEFYADWGDYKVTLTIPERFVVAASGVLAGERRTAGKKVLTFVQENVHDFAWTADPRYTVREASFDPAKDLPASELKKAALILGRPEQELLAGMRPVKLLFYMQPDHEAQWKRYAEAQKWALAWFGLYAFGYPYPQISIIDTPEDGSGASGMEYQMLYTAGTLRGLGTWPFTGLRSPEQVVIHEFAHGYFYGLLASNEFEESWMDEGLASFAEYEVLAKKYLYFLELPLGLGVTGRDLARAYVSSTEDFDPVITKSWTFQSTESYYRNSYARAGILIEQLRQLMGEERFWRAFRAYCERWRFDHPASEDFFEAMGAGSQPVMRAFINQSWYGTGFIDYSVSQARNQRETRFKGIRSAGTAANSPSTPQSKDPERDSWRSEAVILRHGDIKLPVEIQLTFSDGSRARVVWDGTSNWLKLSSSGPRRLVNVIVDPHGKVVIDRNPWNNARYLPRNEGPRARPKLMAYASHLLQIVLSSSWALF